MDDKTKYDAWKVPPLTNREKNEILSKVFERAEKKSPFVRLVPVLSTAVIIVAAVTGYFYFNTGSFEKNLAEVSRLLRHEIEGEEGKVCYYAENSSFNRFDLNREVFHEARGR